jgi:magnesium transporter
MEITTIYLSRLAHAPVFTKENVKIGKLKDIVVHTDGPKPRVAAVNVKTAKGIHTLDYSFMHIEKKGSQYAVYCDKAEDYSDAEKNSLLLMKNVLDRQIVDLNGKKIIRVNDIRLAILSSGTYAIAVDVGIEGLLRRLAIAKPLTVLLRRLNKRIPAKFISWDDIATIDYSYSSYQGIKLSKPYEKMNKLLPEDMADIIEDLDHNSQIAIFSSMDDERAADVLEEMETKARKEIVESLSAEDAADILEIMPADEVADILDDLDEDKAEELLQEMESEASLEVRELMEYEDGTVGSIMTTDYLSFNENLTVGDVLKTLREQKPEASWVYNLYILDDDEELLATVSLRDIAVSEPEVTLKNIMDTNIIFVYTDDDLNTLTETVDKYNLISVPVVDRDRKLQGAVVIEDVVYNLLKSRRRRM